MGLPELAEDPRFATFVARGAHREEVLGRLSARFAERTTADPAAMARTRARHAGCPTPAAM